MSSFGFTSWAWFKIHQRVQRAEHTANWEFNNQSTSAKVREAPHSCVSPWKRRWEDLHYDAGTERQSRDPRLSRLHPASLFSSAFCRQIAQRGAMIRDKLVLWTTFEQLKENWLVIGLQAWVHPHTETEL